ncbi:MAG: pyridoxamine 5'-phosphate oxidase family protein [Anaerolineales bacterium]
MRPRSSSQLPDKLHTWLRNGAPALLLTTGADGYPNAAYTWAAARDAEHVRCGVDHGSTTLANLERDRRAALQVIGPNDLLFIITGAAQVVRAHIEAASFQIAMVEMAVNTVKDQSWPGVTVQPLAYEWPAEQRAELQAMEQAVYAELRSWVVQA